MHAPRRVALLAALLAMPALPAAAVEYNVVQLEKSSIRFVAKQMGVPSAGGFGRFVARIAFDPARPENGRAQIDVDLASIDAGSAEANDEVKGKAWFNVREIPAASFVASQLKALGGGRYEAAGKMSIKGRTQDVVAVFTAKPDGKAMLLDGAIPIRRLQYGIGEGVWADTATVADEVQVRFHFTLNAGPATRK